MIVLDASAAIEIVINPRKIKSLSQAIAEADWVLAPDLFVSEVTNVFWKYYRFKDLPVKQCEEGLEHTISIIDEFESTCDLYQEAFSLACHTKLSAYDAVYLVLSRRKNAALATLDQKLQKVAKKQSLKLISY